MQSTHETSCHKTSGKVPPSLVGASTCVTGSKMYLFGGRSPINDGLFSDLHIYDFETTVWTALPPQIHTPESRCFHSADIWNNQLVIFGGIGESNEGPCVFNDVRSFDLSAHTWTPPAGSYDLPRGRYAHLSSVSVDRLFIIGGQDLNDQWFGEVQVYNLREEGWLQPRDYMGCNTYRAVAVAPKVCVRCPQEKESTIDTTLQMVRSTGAPDTPIHLPYSIPPSDEFPGKVHVFSNDNVADMKLKLDVLSPWASDFTMTEILSVGTASPPPLHFPSAGILGIHLVLAGVGTLDSAAEKFSMWTLDLMTMRWSEFETGHAFSSGSWLHGCMWAEANKFAVFGNADGNFEEVYSGGIMQWDHVTVVDLESFGIYQPPPLVLSAQAQQAGLAALQANILPDWDLICDDGRAISCSRTRLEEGWPWFKEQRKRFQRTAHLLPPSSGGLGSPSGRDIFSDARITTRSFNLSESYPVTLALLQYIYSTALVTPLQQAPAVLSCLLGIASTYDMAHLLSLVQHAMHVVLSKATAAGVYEVATLHHCKSLQTRALRAMKSYNLALPSSPTPSKKGPPQPLRSPPPINHNNRPSSRSRPNLPPHHARGDSLKSEVSSFTGHEIHELAQLVAPLPQDHSPIFDQKRAAMFVETEEDDWRVSPESPRQTLFQRPSKTFTTSSSRSEGTLSTLSGGFPEPPKMWGMVSPSESRFAGMSAVSPPPSYLRSRSDSTPSLRPQKQQNGYHGQHYPASSTLGSSFVAARMDGYDVYEERRQEDVVSRAMNHYHHPPPPVQIYDPNFESSHTSPHLSGTYDNSSSPDNLNLNLPSPQTAKSPTNKLGASFARFLAKSNAPRETVSSFRREAGAVVAPSGGRSGKWASGKSKT